MAGGVGAAVDEGPGRRAVLALGATPLEQLVAEVAAGLAEGPAEHLVGLDDPAVPVQHRHVARDLLEEGLVLALEPLRGGQVGGDGGDVGDLPGLVAQRDHAREVVDGLAVAVEPGFLEHAGPPVLEGLLRGAVGAGSPAVLVDLVAGPPDARPVDLHEGTVVVDDPEVPVHDHDPGGHLLQEVPGPRHRPGGGVHGDPFLGLGHDDERGTGELLGARR